MLRKKKLNFTDCVLFTKIWVYYVELKLLFVDIGAHALQVVESLYHSSLDVPSIPSEDYQEAD